MNYRKPYCYCALNDPRWLGWMRDCETPTVPVMPDARLKPAMR
jgi:hypothetical protein